MISKGVFPFRVHTVRLPDDTRNSSYSFVVSCPVLGPVWNTPSNFLVVGPYRCSNIPGNGTTIDPTHRNPGGARQTLPVCGYSPGRGRGRKSFPVPHPPPFSRTLTAVVDPLLFYRYSRVGPKEERGCAHPGGSPSHRRGWGNSGSLETDPS